MKNKLPPRQTEVLKVAKDLFIKLGKIPSFRDLAGFLEGNESSAAQKRAASIAATLKKKGLWTFENPGAWHPEADQEIILPTNSYADRMENLAYESASLNMIIGNLKKMGPKARQRVMAYLVDLVKELDGEI